MEALRSAQIEAPDDVIPLAFVDDWSLACLSPDGNADFGWRPGEVVRWHLGDIPIAHQGARLDVDVDSYLSSLLEELGPAWAKGYDAMMSVSEAYRRKFVDPQVTPKADDLRPFQLACQNVILGLAAFRRDARIDGQAVPYWLTCEAPHVATYEGTRALIALLLCDAFQSGGTMEIGFAQHAERRVPASIRRYGRVVGVEVGREIRSKTSISPTEARALFRAVTPMPDGLRERCDRLVAGNVCSVERLCFTLLAAVWSAPALDFLAGTASSARLASILEGGAHTLDRAARSPEMHLSRAAVLFDTFYRRINQRDTAGVAQDGVTAARMFEDTTWGVTWHVEGDSGVVELINVPPGPLPWHPNLHSRGKIVVLPRPHPIRADYELASQLSARYGVSTPVALLTATGVEIPNDETVPVLRCPVRLPEIDLQIDRASVSARLARS